MNDPFPYRKPACVAGTCNDTTCTHYRSARCPAGTCSHGTYGVDCSFTPEPTSIFGGALGMIGPDDPIPNLTWVSMPYSGGSTAGPLAFLAGPDAHYRCETPRCLGQGAGAAPVAEHLEMLWDSSHPGMPRVMRAWKTCASCHIGMNDTHQNGA